MTPSEQWANERIASLLPYDERRGPPPTLYQLLYAQAILSHPAVYAVRDRVQFYRFGDGLLGLYVVRCNGPGTYIDIEIDREVELPDREGSNFVVGYWIGNVSYTMKCSPANMREGLSEAFAIASVYE